MKTLKGRFIKTMILMVAISTALVVLITLLLLFVVSVSQPDGFERIWVSLTEFFEGSYGPKNTMQGYVILWAVLSVGVVILTCIALSAKISKEILSPLKVLQKSAENITEGNLSFEVLTCDDKELNELCLSFDEIRKKLKINREQEMRSKEERNMLMANLSHDMRTPITTIKGYLEGIKDGVANTPEKMDRYLDTIYSKALVLEKLVDNMTEYAELELGRMQYAFEFVDLTEFVREWLKGCTEEIQEKGISVESHFTSKSLTIVADPAKLKRVLDNLISNAVKYNKEEGRISLCLETESKGALLCISDSGTGIAEKDMGKVFHGFYRGDAARSNIKGNGLGLGISKQIIESHHGKIWIKSIEGSGTEVFIYLPLRDGM